MKHHKIQKTSRHRKLKVVSASNWSDNEDVEDNQQPKRNESISGNPSKLRKTNVKSKRAIEKNKLTQIVPRRVKELFQAAAEATKKKMSKNKFKTTDDSPLNPLLDELNEIERREDESGATRGVKLRPESIKQGPYESNDQFMRRLNKLASSAKFEAVIEQRFNVDLCPKVNDDSVPRKPQILSTVDGSVYDEDKEREKKKKRKSQTAEDESQVPNKVLKRRVRDAKRKLKKKKGVSKRGSSSAKDDFNNYVDEVSFGDVVQRPPSLSKFKTKRRI